MDIVERARLKSKYIRMKFDADLFDELADEIEFLRKERDRLREALKQIIEPIGPSYPDSLIHNDLKIIEIARAALKD